MNISTNHAMSPSKEILDSFGWRISPTTMIVCLFLSTLINLSKLIISFLVPIHVPIDDPLVHRSQRSCNPVEQDRIISKDGDGNFLPTDLSKLSLDDLLFLLYQLQEKTTRNSVMLSNSASSSSNSSSSNSIGWYSVQSLSLSNFHIIYLRTSIFVSSFVDTKIFSCCSILSSACWSTLFIDSIEYCRCSQTIDDDPHQTFLILPFLAFETTSFTKWCCQSTSSITSQENLLFDLYLSTISTT